MATLAEVTVPDIGDFEEIPVIEILVAPGDQVSAESPLITLESDKATMDVPAPMDGVVREIKVAVGDNVSQGSLIVLLETAAAPAASPNDDTETQSRGVESTPERAREPEPGPGPGPSPTAQGAASVIEITVPDIGDFDGIPVIEILVSVGDAVEMETPLVTLESDKATMDVPSPVAGIVTALKVAVGDNVSEGTLVALVSSIVDADGPHASTGTGPDTDDSAAASASATTQPAADARAPNIAASGGRQDSSVSPADELMEKFHSSEPDPRAPLHRPAPTAGMDQHTPPAATSHATPAVRRFARELGVELALVNGSGRKGRISREDVTRFVKGALAQPSGVAASAASATGGAMGIEPIPAVDFSRFGEIEEQKLSRIQRISGPFLHRAWLNIPHVTHHDEIDVTELEAFRKSLADEAKRRDLRVTTLTFIMKALAASLAEFPALNSSLGSDGTTLILKKYFNIGIAVDTPGGLVVPVFRDVDKKGIFDLAAEMADVSSRARDGKLKADDLQGGCISISSLGGIGGTAFTPIVNAPEVAILGVSRAKMQPLWNGDAFVPRLMLPLDLSYDHRVIDGAQAARFVVFLGNLLSDIRRLVL